MEKHFRLAGWPGWLAGQVAGWLQALVSMRRMVCKDVERARGGGARRVAGKQLGCLGLVKGGPHFVWDHWRFRNIVALMCAKTWPLKKALSLCVCAHTTNEAPARNTGAVWAQPNRIFHDLSRVPKRRA